MVCSHCKSAGEIPNTARDEPSRRAAKALRRVLHNKCAGCDCQHREPREEPNGQIR